MQSVDALFHAKATSPVRGISSRVLISFLKNYDPAVTFFTIGVSSIGGPDVIRGDNSVIQEWDKYDYEDFANRLISMEYVKQMDAPKSPITLSMADIVLDNHDDIFTPENTNSPYYGYLKAQRPIKLFTGFQHAYELPIFVGVTEGPPVIDAKAKTAKFHCIDFLKTIMDRKLSEEIILEDYRTDQIKAYLLESVGGLLPSQYQLDTGTVVIPFAYFKKDMVLGDALRQIDIAELGTTYMDEQGVIRGENRTNWLSKVRVWGFDDSQVIETQSPSTDTIINTVEVIARPRAVQANQMLWESASYIEVPANGTYELFANFKDDYGDLPVTTIDEPEYLTSATTSLYATNVNSDGSGDPYNSYITLTSFDEFGTGCKAVFTNTASVPVYITQLEIWARPAKVTNDIYLKVSDADSVGSNNEGFDERILTIDSDYIQDETAANSIAQIVLGDWSMPQFQKTMTVKGQPQLQVGDLVGYKNRRIDQTYFLTKISGMISPSTGHRQILTGSQRTIEKYFTIGVSTIGGTDKIAP